MANNNLPKRNKHYGIIGENLEEEKSHLVKDRQL